VLAALHQLAKRGTIPHATVASAIAHYAIEVDGAPSWER
jgi:pyruvate dehydrogenase complex dehydrogenase (E1) component